MLAAEVAQADLQTQGADGVIDDLGLVRAEVQQVAVLGARAFQDGLERAIVDVLNDGRLQACAQISAGLTGAEVVDLDPGQALGAIDLDEFGVAVDVPARHRSTTGHAQGHHAATHRVGWTTEDLEVHIFHHIGDFGELKLHPQVGLV